MLSRTQRIIEIPFSLCFTRQVVACTMVPPRSLSIPSDQRVKEWEEKLTCEEKTSMTGEKGESVYTFTHLWCKLLGPFMCHSSPFVFQVSRITQSEVTH